MGAECHRILEKKTTTKQKTHTMGHPFRNKEITTLYLCKDLKTMCIHSNHLFNYTVMQIS